MTRNLLIATGALIAVAVMLYAFAFRPKPPPPDNAIAQLVDAAEHLCLSNTSSTSTATIQSQLATIKGLSAGASAGTARVETRGAIAALEGTLKAQENDKIRACMQPYSDKMLTLIH
ncbi:MAG TPA: hypothetical protein VNT42_10990 [Sphingomonas sp.]|nr:hypothetical protein [Sphingomonas sp.]